MNILDKLQNKEIGVLLQRIGLSILILFHGIANLTTDYSFIKGFLNTMGAPVFIAYLICIGDIVAPLLIIIGCRASLVSAILAFIMLIAVLMAYHGDIFILNQFGGWGIELQGLYLFGAISIFFMGAGRCAVSTDSIWD